MPATPERSIDHAKEGRAVHFDSVEEAFVRYATPVGNLEMIRRMVAEAGQATIVGFRTYFKIERGSGPALEVHDGYTTGFRSEADAIRLAGPERPRWESRRFRGAWGITHAETRHRPIADARQPRAARAPREPRVSAPRAATATEPREGQICMSCFMQMPLTGVCPNCG